MGIKLNLQIQMFKLSKVLVATLLLSSVEGRNLNGMVEVERSGKGRGRNLEGVVEVKRAAKERGIDKSEESMDKRVKDLKSKVVKDYGDVVEAEEAKEATEKFKLEEEKEAKEVDKLKA